MSAGEKDFDLIALSVRECAQSWSADARLLGNVRADEIVALCDAFTTLTADRDRLAGEVRSLFADIAGTDSTGDPVIQLPNVLDVLLEIRQHIENVEKELAAARKDAARLDMNPPKPTYTVEISVGGCDWETVMSRFVEAAEHAKEHGPQCKSVWGGAGTHGHIHVQQRDVTEETYEAELSAWFDATRATRATPDAEVRDA